MKFYWQLFRTFFRIGAFTIGGGYAMIPLIQDEIVDKKQWIAQDEFIDMLAMAQSAPGILAINTSIFVGYRLRGVKGSLVASLGTALPSFLIILCVASLFTQADRFPAVERAFKAIRPAVVALIVAPLYRMGRSAGIGWKTIWIPIVAAVLIWQLGVSPILIVILAMAGGLAWHYIQLRSQQKNH